MRPRAAAALLIGFAVAFAAGAITAEWVQHAGGWQSGTQWDNRLLVEAHRGLPRWLDVILLIVPWFGTNITIIAVLIPFCFWLRRRARQDLIWPLGIVAAGSYLLNLLMKFAYGRPRPSLWQRRGEYSWSSYPSGHAIAMMSVLLIGAWLYHRERGTRWQFVAWLLIAPLMVYSRVYLGVHWPTDVVAGILIGAVWGLTVWLVFRRKLQPMSVR